MQRSLRVGASNLDILSAAGQLLILEADVSKKYLSVKFRGIKIIKNF